jgi:hypothetical protein
VAFTESSALVAINQHPSYVKPLAKKLAETCHGPLIPWKTIPDVEKHSGHPRAQMAAEIIYWRKPTKLLSPQATVTYRLTFDRVIKQTTRNTQILLCGGIFNPFSRWTHMAMRRNHRQDPT